MNFQIKCTIFLWAALLFACMSSQEPISTKEKIMYDNLKNKWTKLISKFTTKQALITESWEEIVAHYSEKNRAYHNLTHINNMLIEAAKFEDKIVDKAVLLFAIWFHDIIYDPMSKDNEKESAEFAKKVLKQTNLSKERIAKCYDLIMLTLKHQPEETAHLDDKLLVDFDLEILSRDWESYKIYSGQVRKEYWIYPALLFKKGRKKQWENF